ncbi:unnamed protein product [Boreogadus saida]
MVGSASSPGSPQSLDGLLLLPGVVTDWFLAVVSRRWRSAAQPKRDPRARELERNGPLTTIILQTASGSRVSFLPHPLKSASTGLRRSKPKFLPPILPNHGGLTPLRVFIGVEYQRRPRPLSGLSRVRTTWCLWCRGVAAWPRAGDGKPLLGRQGCTEVGAISGFYLLPCCSPLGRAARREWRMAAPADEVQLKKCIPFPMAQAFQAAKAVLSRLLSRPRTGLSPYHLRTLLFWACDRLPASYLSSPETDTPGRLLLGLLDDLAHCILGKNCPNYFLPQCNMLEHLSDGQALLLARKLGHVRSDPAEHLRAALDQARQARQLKKEALAGGGGGGANGQAGSPGHGPANGIISPCEDKLAQRLQQLVTENPGKSISVFLNPDDVTRPHFRIDDKFY